jgi:hypothetical protein
VTKRTLLSLVPNDFSIDPFDPIAFGYQADLVSQQMMTDGVMPYSALDVFRQVLGGTARTQERPGYLILGEAVSKAQFVLWKEATRNMRAGVWLRLMLDNVADQDKDARDRATYLIPEICRDFRYWKLCNTGKSIILYRPELRARGGRL